MAFCVTEGEEYWWCETFTDLNKGDALQTEVQEAVKIMRISRHAQKGLIKLFVSTNNLIVLIWKLCKGKATPLQARTGPEGSRRLRDPDFKTIGILGW